MPQNSPWKLHVIWKRADILYTELLQKLYDLIKQNSKLNKLFCISKEKQPTIVID